MRLCVDSRARPPGLGGWLGPVLKGRNMTVTGSASVANPDSGRSRRGPEARPRPCRVRPVFAVAVLSLSVACGGGSRSPVSTGAASPPPGASSLQQLFESGRHSQVLEAVAEDATDAEALWLAAHSHLRLDQRDAAERRFTRLRAIDAGPAWQTAADLGLALLSGDAAALDIARGAAEALAGEPFVQFELGLANARRNDFAAAAQAFDRCAEARPRFAYAYYNAALAYDRIDRTDLAVIRFETFQRLAPQAPERPEVEALLRTVRAR